MIELVCCDMAGTTVDDGGLVLEAFARTLDGFDLDEAERELARRYVVETMGQSKIDVFTVLFGDRAHEANERFEDHVEAVARERGVREVPGARSALEAVRARGLAVALTTGFSPRTREALIDAMGWDELVPVRVSPADAGRGRPAPDMILVCALRTRVHSLDRVAVVGDTASDMESGIRAGAGLVIGVLSGTDDATRLRDAGAHLVIDSVSHLAHALVERSSQ